MEIIEIGTKIKKMREFKDFTQDDFAKLLGVSKSALWNYENNKRLIPLDLLVKASNILQVNFLEDILELIEIKPISSMQTENEIKKKINELQVVSKSLAQLKKIEQDHQKLIDEQQQVINIQSDLINKQEIIINHNKKTLETYKNA